MNRIAKWATSWAAMACLAGCGQTPLSVTSHEPASVPAVEGGQQPVIPGIEPSGVTEGGVKPVKLLARIQEKHEAFIKAIGPTPDQELRIRSIHAAASAQFVSSMQPHLELLATQLSVQPVDAAAIQATLETLQTLCRQQVATSIEMLGQIREILTDGQLTKAIRFLRTQSALTDVEQMSAVTAQMSEVLKLDPTQLNALEALVAQGKPATLARREQLNQALVTFFQTGEAQNVEQAIRSTMPARSVVPSVAFISALSPIQRQALLAFVKDVLAAHQEAMSVRS
jgi:hypothetical protein